MLTQEDLDRRRKHVTATDVPKILGDYPKTWGNIGDVFAEKVYGTVQGGNNATRAGLLLEPSVLAWATDELGTLVGGGWHSRGILGATLDEMTLAGEPVEAKTSGITGPGKPSEWGDEYTDEIPAHYLWQVQTQMLVVGASRAFVPALIGNRGFLMYVVEANAALQTIIRNAAEEFWNEHILTGIPPADVNPNLETLKRLVRVPGKTVEVEDHLAANYFRTNELAKLANDEHDNAKRALIAAIGDGEVGKWSEGEFTYKTQTRKSYTVAESSCRVLRPKRAKVQA